MHKPLILAALSASALMAASPALAGAAALRIGDLDLTSEAGKAELARRIDVAVREACPEETVTGTRLADRSSRDECVSEARKQIEAFVARRTNRANKSS
jgi:UrcA family protein